MIYPFRQYLADAWITLCGLIPREGIHSFLTKGGFASWICVAPTIPRPVSDVFYHGPGNGRRGGQGSRFSSRRMPHSELHASSPWFRCRALYLSGRYQRGAGHSVGQSMLARDHEFGVAFVAIDPEVTQQLVSMWFALKTSESRAKAS